VKCCCLGSQGGRRLHGEHAMAQRGKSGGVTSGSRSDVEDMAGGSREQMPYLAVNIFEADALILLDDPSRARREGRAEVSRTAG
jgi:hypothetical protein